MICIFFVEDEFDFVDLLVYLLCCEGYEVEIVEDGFGVFVVFCECGVDIVFFDLMFLGMFGIEVCCQICLIFVVLIIMFMVKDFEVDIVVGFEFGVDDYIIKLYFLCELFVWMWVVLCCVVQVDSEFDEWVLEGGCVLLDIDWYIVLVVGMQINMLFKEFELLEVLMCNFGWVFICGQLIDCVWGSDYFGDIKMFDVYIKWICFWIEENLSELVMLVIVCGLGYCFEG